MKKTSIAILLLATVFHVGSASAGGIKHNKFHHKLLTKDKVGLQDPYYQVKRMKVKALTDEEALRFVNDEKEEALFQHVVTKDFIGTVPGGIPNIPPIPPQAGGGGANIPTIPGNVPGTPGGNGGLGTGTGPGGNIPGYPGGIGGTPTTGVVGGILQIVDQLIAIGERIMPTIEKGKAIVTNNPMAAISVLPRIDAKDPVVHDMGDWSLPVSKHFKITFENGFGTEVVSFVYSISFQHSGTYNEKGHYLAGVRASARQIRINWGFDLDASSQLIQISNVGTSKNVIAAATIEISYTVKNWTRTTTTVEGFMVTGDGRVIQLD